MSNIDYNRNAVPVGGSISLEVQFSDVAGNPKDTDATPTIQIFDATDTPVISTTSSNIRRIATGRYSYKLQVPDGYTQGIWNDIWVGQIDGYSLTSVFDFYVSSVGKLEAVGTVITPDPQLGDEPVLQLTREEVTNINILLRILKSRVQNISRVMPDGTHCEIFTNLDLLTFLCASLSEFNATPTITNYDFNNMLTSSTFSDILTQGAYLIAMASIATHEAGREFVINDNGVTINPPPVSTTITGLYNAQLADYRAKLKEIKRNHRPRPEGLGAGRIVVANPVVARLRHLKERRIL